MEALRIVIGDNYNKMSLFIYFLMDLNYLYVNNMSNKFALIIIMVSIIITLKLSCTLSMTHTHQSGYLWTFELCFWFYKLKHVFISRISSSRLHLSVTVYICMHMIRMERGGSLFVSIWNLPSTFNLEEG